MTALAGALALATGAVLLLQLGHLANTWLRLGTIARPCPRPANSPPGPRS